MGESSRWWNGTAVGDASIAPYDAPSEFAKPFNSFIRGNTYPDQGGVFKNELKQLSYTIGVNLITVGAGRAIVYGSWYENDAPVAIAVPSPVGATRKDLFVLRKDWAAQTIRIVKLLGAEGGAVPAPTQTVGVTWELPLYEVDITVGGVITVIEHRDWLPFGTQEGTVLYNNSGSTLGIGTVVVDDTSRDFSFKLTNIEDDQDVIGVIRGNDIYSIPIGDMGTILCDPGNVVFVYVVSATNRGDWLTTSTTPGAAKPWPSIVGPAHVFARAMQSLGAPGLCLAMLTGPFMVHGFSGPAGGLPVTVIDKDFGVIDVSPAPSGEVTIYSRTIPGKTLGTYNKLVLNLMCDWFGSVGSFYGRIKVKYGGSTFIDMTIDAAGVTNDASRRAVKIIVELMAHGATNNQLASAQVIVGSVSGLGATSGAVPLVTVQTLGNFSDNIALAINGGIDSTADKNLDVTWENVNASADADFKRYSAVLELQ